MSWRAALARSCAALAVLALALSTSIFVSPIASADTITSTPTSGTVDVAGSTGFSQQLSPTTDTDGSSMSSSQDVGGQSPDLTITGGGLVSVIGGPLPVGSYDISGSTAAGPGDAGTWTYSLSVTADSITSSPASGTVDVAGSTNFSQQLTQTDTDGGTVAYVQGGTGQSPDLTITGGGLVSVVGGPLPVGNYAISGTSSDGFENSGNWSYSLSVTADTITSSPTSGTIDVAGSTSFHQQLTQTDTDGGTVAYVQGGTGQSPDLTITGDVLVKVVGGPLHVRSYAISGTSSDGFENSGNWSYSLSVTADTIVQGTPTSGSTNTASSTAFSSTLSAS